MRRRGRLIRRCRRRGMPSRPPRTRWRGVRGRSPGWPPSRLLFAMGPRLLPKIFFSKYMGGEGIVRSKFSRIFKVLCRICQRCRQISTPKCSSFSQGVKEYTPPGGSRVSRQSAKTESPQINCSKAHTNPSSPPPPQRSGRCGWWVWGRRRRQCGAQCDRHIVCGAGRGSRCQVGGRPRGPCCLPSRFWQFV